MCNKNSMESLNQKNNLQPPIPLGINCNEVLSNHQNYLINQSAKHHLLKKQTKNYQKPIKQKSKDINQLTNARSSMSNQQVRYDSETNASKFSPLTDNVFARIASRYDLICNLFSLGLHHFWKRRFIQHINKESWQNLLDIASGTGEIAYKLLKQSDVSSQLNGDGSYLYVAKNHFFSINRISKDTMSAKTYFHHYHPSTKQIIVSDLSEQMLNAAKLKLTDYKNYTKFMPLDAHDMTQIASNSQDVVSISMGLKLLDRQKALKEALRVLKPNGRLITMEVSIISINWLHKLYLIVLSILLPIIALFTAGKDRSVYRYLIQGIKHIPTADELAKEIQDIGFDDVVFERLNLGIVAIHKARKKRG